MTTVNTIRLGLIGGGFMGEALLRGLVQAGVICVEESKVAEPVEARRRQLQAMYPGLDVMPSATEAVHGADLVLIAVKPQDFANLAGSLRGSLSPRQLVLSIMAGVPLAALAERLQHERVVRAMPNTPAAIGEGFTAWVPAACVTQAECAMTRRVFAAVGRELQVADDRYVDMATAMNGSGPAYVFLFLEGLIDAAVHIGLPRAVAREMVLQTVLGSVKMAVEDGQHPAQLRNMVTSPGGTTAAGLLVLERSALRATLTDAVIAAYERSRALGG